MNVNRNGITSTSAHCSGVRRSHPEAARITAPMGPDRVTDLLLALRDAASPGRGECHQATLDEVFLTITGHATDDAASAEHETEEVAA